MNKTTNLSTLKDDLSKELSNSIINHTKNNVIKPLNGQKK
jgi:hypothetical protein